MHMVKDDWPSKYDWPASWLEVESSDLACTWSKMIEPPGMTDQDLT